MITRTMYLNGRRYVLEIEHYLGTFALPGNYQVRRTFVYRNPVRADHLATEWPGMTEYVIRES